MNENAGGNPRVIPNLYRREFYPISVNQWEKRTMGEYHGARPYGGAMAHFHILGDIDERLGTDITMIPDPESRRAIDHGEMADHRITPHHDLLARPDQRK